MKRDLFTAVRSQSPLFNGLRPAPELARRPCMAGSRCLCRAWNVWSKERESTSSSPSDRLTSLEICCYARVVIRSQIVQAPEDVEGFFGGRETALWHRMCTSITNMCNYCLYMGISQHNRGERGEAITEVSLWTLVPPDHRQHGPMDYFGATIDWTRALVFTVASLVRDAARGEGRSRVLNAVLAGRFSMLLARSWWAGH